MATIYNFTQASRCPRFGSVPDGFQPLGRGASRNILNIKRAYDIG